MVIVDSVGGGHFVLIVYTVGCRHVYWLFIYRRIRAFCDSNIYCLEFGLLIDIN